MVTQGNQKVIFGVLNWGLGHATRSIPLIRALAHAGYEPVIASDGAALELLRTEFPDLKVEELPAYNIRYSKKGGVLVALFWQLPGIWRAARQEHRVLNRLVSEYRPVGVISDNRLGFHHPEVPSVYITHQLKLMLPFARRWISGFHHRFIRNFSECWVPDYNGAGSLTGEMTRNIDPGVPVHFIGPQSRFERLPKEQKKYVTCSVLSGPEPQRTLLEEKLLSQLSMQPGKHLLVRGIKSKRNQSHISGISNSNIELVDFLNGASLARRIAQAEIVISRSGYSSLMDYRVLGNRALLIPTPGQPEQEYLARYMLSRGWFFYSDQEHLDLNRDLEKAMRFKGFEAYETFPRYDRVADLFRLFKGDGKS